jgi:hypothetical protein
MNLLCLGNFNLIRLFNYTAVISTLTDQNPSLILFVTSIQIE